MDIASVFDWFARDSMHAAEESDDPRQRETLLKLALQWGTAAEQSRAEASPQQSYEDHAEDCIRAAATHTLSR